MKVLFLFGTRPEAIKLAPVILATKKDPFFKVQVCVTAQHREMLDQILQVFDIVPDVDLNLMKPNQSLATLTARAVEGIDETIRKLQPDICIIQGDTTTVLAGALACFYNKVKVAHVEAGLRTGNKFSPYPEEINRVLTTQLCDLHFAPTSGAAEHLLKASVCESKIVITGNTVIDALLLVKQLLDDGKLKVTNKEVVELLNGNKKKTILITTHRRENFGEGIENICLAVTRIAEAFPEVQIAFPVHLNPNVKDHVFATLGNYENIRLLAPLDYVSFVALMNYCHIILTDSGGVQEEAPSLGKPVLVMRDTTERPEAIAAGNARLVGTNADTIFHHVKELLEDEQLYNSIASRNNPFGDGKAAEKITSTLKSLYA